VPVGNLSVWLGGRALGPEIGLFLLWKSCHGLLQGEWGQVLHEHIGVNGRSFNVKKLCEANVLMQDLTPFPPTAGEDGDVSCPLINVSAKPGIAHFRIFLT